MTSFSYGPVFDLAIWHDASRPLLSIPSSTKAYIDGRIKERQSQKPLVRVDHTLEQLSISLEELHFLIKTFKTSRMISQSKEQW
jgi:hypothetical protein